MRTQVEWNVDTHIERARRAHQLHHPLAHLGGGLVGERDGQHLPDADLAGGQQVGDAAGQHRRLTGARAGHDQQRRTLVQHRLALLRVEAVQEFRRHRVGEMRVMSAPIYRWTATLFALARTVGGTLNLVLSQQRRFFYGYRPAVPVV